MPNENAISNYNSLQATIEQRLSHGLNFNFNYVWSHFLDDLDSAGWGSHSGTTNWQNAYNPCCELRKLKLRRQKCIQRATFFISCPLAAEGSS